MTSARVAEAREPGSDTADREIFWLNCEELVGLTDAELDTWKSRGVDGFVCMVRHLRGMGGTQDFTGDPNASLAGENYELQRTLRDSNLVQRAAAREMKMYLGVYLVNYWNPATPLSDWFDDAGWSTVALPKLQSLSEAARLLGFAGLAFDQELYPQASSTSATWDWDYPGNTHSEAEVRAQAKQRGQQVMQTIVNAFPGVEVMAYDVQFPETWQEYVQEAVNGNKDAFANRLDIDFWDGLSGVEGYGAIRLVDATFYKTPHLGSWDTALEYHYNSIYAYLSRRLSNWRYASSRLFVSPFSWIDQGPCGCGFDDPRPPEYVEKQLLAFRKWGTGGEFANYAHQGLDEFDYSPYIGAMQAASVPGSVDPKLPDLEIIAADEATPATIEGAASDNLAIRAVRWHDDRGGSGVAKLRWETKTGDHSSGFAGETHWSIRTADLNPRARRVTVVAEDIKGHVSEPSSAPVADNRAPRTRITKRPRARSDDRSPRFRFRADERGSVFECKLDRRGWARCDRGRAGYRLSRGRHRFMVRAIDRAGNVDPTPARARFKISKR